MLITRWFIMTTELLKEKRAYFNVNTPKTEAGNRQVPMLDFVKEAFVMEKERQELLGSLRMKRP